MTLWHYTTTTGHGRASPRSEVSAEALESTRRIVQAAADNGDAELVDGYRLTALTVAPGGLASWVIAAPDGAALVECRLTPGDAPRLDVRLLPALVDHAAAARWMGDAERCIAWAILPGR